MDQMRTSTIPTLQVCQRTFTRLRMTLSLVSLYEKKKRRDDGIRIVVPNIHIKLKPVNVC
jgi:hypothetical protein